MPDLREIAEDAQLKAEQLQAENDKYEEDDKELDMDFYFRSGQITAYESISKVLHNLSEEKK